MSRIFHMPDFSKCLLGIVGTAGGFALDHVSIIASGLAAFATALFMFGCAHEKWIVVRRLKKQGTEAPFPGTQAGKKHFK